MSNMLVEVNRNGPISTVTMCRPEVHNAFNEHLITELRETFKGFHEDSTTRVIVLSGKGRSFSAGADVDWMRRAYGLSEDQNRRDALALGSMLKAIAKCPQPLIAKIQGAALGGGAGLVAAADIAIAGQSTRFGFTEVRLGLVPAVISSHVFGKIGPGRALPLFLTGERFDAAFALSIGLIHRIAPDDLLEVAVEEVTESLLSGGPHAQAACKEMVRNFRSSGDAGMDDYSANLIARIRTSDEGREGIQAFFEKRKPSWSGEDSPLGSLSRNRNRRGLGS